MKKGSGLPILLLGIADVLLAACVVFVLLTGHGQVTAGIGRVSQTESDKSESSSEDIAESQASYAGIITAEYQDGSEEVSATSESYEEQTTEITPEITPESEQKLSDEAEASDMPAGDFIFPDSSSRVISDAEIQSALTTKTLCQRAVNEIFARHGYLFHADKNPTDYAYFNSLSWYQAMTKVDSASAVEAEFNSAESANVNAFLAYRNSLNG